MKNWLKKQKYKIAIALCSILSIFTLFLGINKTYAYETNQFSYTINNIYDASTSQNVVLDNINNVNGFLYQYGASNTSFELINNISNYDNKYFLINYYFIDTNTNTFMMSPYGGSFKISFSLFYKVGNQFNTVSIATNQSLTSSYSTNNLFTTIGKFSINNNTTNIYLIIGGLNNFPSNYGIYVSNIDIVDSSDIGLQQYYETYYGQIEDNYNTLLSDYNDLQEDYSTLETNYNTLESNYNTLDNDYNNLQSEYNNYANFRNYNDFYNLTARIQYDINNTIDLSFNELINDNILSNNQINLLKIRRYLENNNLYNSSFKFRVWFYFDTNYVKATFGNIYWLCKNNNLSNISIDFEMLDSLQESYTIQISIDSGDTILNYDSLLNNQINGNYNNTTDLIDNIYFNFNYELSNDYIIISEGQYAYGYNVGYNQGYSSASNYYTDYFNNYYQPQITSLNDEINTLNTTITNMQLTINALNEQIRAFSSDYGINNMLWTIGSTPFESFKQIWNVNLFGVNISRAVTGFITAIIVLFVVKKFFL